MEQAALNPEEDQDAEDEIVNGWMGTMLSALTPVFGSYESLSNN